MKKVWLIRQHNVEGSRDSQEVYLVLHNLKEAHKILKAITMKYSALADKDIMGNKDDNWADENLYIEESVIPERKDNLTTKIEYMLKKTGYGDDVTAYEDFIEEKEDKKEKRRKAIEKFRKEARLKIKREVAAFKKQQKELEAYRQGKLKDPRMIEFYKKKDELLKRHL